MLLLATADMAVSSTVPGDESAIGPRACTCIEFSLEQRGWNLKVLMQPGKETRLICDEDV